MSERVEKDQPATSEADQQDQLADAQDAEDDRADMSANLHAWLHDDDKAGAASDERQPASRDRAAARDDRKTAATERSPTNPDADDIREV